MVHSFPTRRSSDLHVWAAGSIGRYKLPTRLRLIAALPRNASGKVLKRELRERIAAGDLTLEEP